MENLLDQVMPGDESDDDADHLHCPRVCAFSTVEDFLRAKEICDDAKRKKRKEKKDRLSQELDDFNLAFLDLQEFEKQQKLVSDALSQPPSTTTHFLHSSPLTVDPLIGFEPGQLNEQRQQQQQQQLQYQPLPQLNILEGDLAVSSDDPPSFESTLSPRPNGLPLPRENEGEDEQSTPRSPLTPSSMATVCAIADAVEIGKNLDKCRDKHRHDMT